MNAIELRDMTAGDEGLAHVHDLNLTVGAGEIVALLGPNGAGKTTTVRAISGMVNIHHGSVTLSGVDVTNAPSRVRARHGLATVTHDRVVFTQLTVAENLRVGARRAKPPPIDSWFPELEPLLDRRAGLLSGGEQTMVALARALACQPRMLVVDELTAGLAPRFVERMLMALLRAATEWQTGVLFAEQNAHLALDSADRAIVLRRGRVALEGSAAEVAGRAGVLESTYMGDTD